MDYIWMTYYMKPIINIISPKKKNSTFEWNPIHSFFYMHTSLQRESQNQVMSLSDGFYILFSGMFRRCVKSFAE